jgi:hypothetical protein
MISPYAFAVVRTSKRRQAKRSSATIIRRLQRERLRNESIRWFVVELIFFGLLAALSAESLFRAFAALRFL